VGGGRSPIDQVVSVGKSLFDLGASQLSLGDTIGVGTAGAVGELLDAFNAAGLSDDVLAVHFHDTYGQALANAYAAYLHGVRTFDASAGGLGGCPYAESATGNLATEDLVLDVPRPRCGDRRRPGRPGRDQSLDGRTSSAARGPSRVVTALG